MVLLQLQHKLSEEHFDRRLQKTCDTIHQMVDQMRHVINRQSAFPVDHAFDSKGVMVWAGFSSNGISGPEFFDEKENMNSITNCSC